MKIEPPNNKLHMYILIDKFLFLCENDRDLFFLKYIIALMLKIVYNITNRTIRFNAVSNFSVESIADIAHIMNAKKKLKKFVGQCCLHQYH